MSNVSLILTTAGSLDDARRIGRALVEEKLAACANLIPGLTSIYRWKGSVTEDAEVLLLLKTEPTRVADLEHRLRELHSYEVPEFLVIDTDSASQAYAAWVTESTVSA